MVYTYEVKGAWMDRPWTRADVAAICAEIEAAVCSGAARFGGDLLIKCMPAMDGKNEAPPALSIGDDAVVQLLVGGPAGAMQWAAAGKVPFEQWAAGSGDRTDDVVLAVDANVQKYKSGRLVLLSEHTSPVHLHHLNTTILPILGKYGVHYEKEGSKRGGRQKYSSFKEGLKSQKMDERLALHNAKEMAGDY